MKLNLLSCDAAKPDRRAISRVIAEIAIDVDDYTATELTAIILDGDPVDIELGDDNTSSAFRALRKVGIDYEIVE